MSVYDILSVHWEQRKDSNKIVLINNSSNNMEDNNGNIQSLFESFLDQIGQSTYLAILSFSLYK
jgi:hypothetical protein